MRNIKGTWLHLRNYILGILGVGYHRTHIEITNGVKYFNGKKVDKFPEEFERRIQETLKFTEKQIKGIAKKI